MSWYFKADAWQARTECNHLLRKRQDLSRLHSVILKESLLEFQQCF